jgi:uncharacterized protein YfaP (DUF2135 family)
VVIFSTPKKEESKGNIIDPSQYLIEMTWTDDSPNDIDLWVANPNNQIAYFGTREIGGMTLDTDNLGIGNTYITDSAGNTVVNKTRREVASIRTPIAGTYTVNVLLYGNRNNKPETIRVRVFKLNPYKDVIEKEVILETQMQETTIVQFDIDKDGKFLSKSESEQVSLMAKLKP